MEGMPITINDLFTVTTEPVTVTTPADKSTI
jgi:hypothetical protein